MLRPIILVLTLAVPYAHAQCDPTWLAVPDAETRWFSNPSSMPEPITVWDPDGPGPQTPRFLVRVRELILNGQASRNALCTWDGGSFTPLVSGIGPQAVSGAATMPDGQFFLLTSEAVPILNVSSRLLHWNGSSIAAIPGLQLSNASTPSALITPIARSDGSLVVFTKTSERVGSSPPTMIPGTRHIAVWNGLNWSPLGPEVEGNEIHNAFPVGNDQFVIAGSFNTIGGTPFPGFALWDGQQWQPFPAPGTIHGLLAADGNGRLLISRRIHNSTNLTLDLYDHATGSIQNILEVPSTWFSAHLPRFDFINGSLVVNGRFTRIAGIEARGFARWDGQQWLPIQPGLSLFNLAQASPPPLLSLAALPDGQALISGVLNAAAGLDTVSFASFDTNTWSFTNDLPPIRRPADRATALPDGRVAVASRFRLNPVSISDGLAPTLLPDAPDFLVSQLGSFRGQPVTTGTQFFIPDNPDIAVAWFRSSILRLDGDHWTPIADRGASVLLSTHTGDLIVAGDFTSIQDVLANRIARFTPDGWSPLADGLPAVPSALAEMPSGDIIAAFASATQDYGSIARFNGTAWSPFPASANAAVGHLLVTDDGHLIAAGTFTSFNQIPIRYIAQWDGNAWSPMGNAFPHPVRSLTQAPDGTILALTRDTPTNATPSLWAWNGTAWSTIPIPLTDDFDRFSISNLVPGPGPEVTVTGNFTHLNGEIISAPARLSLTGIPWFARNPADAHLIPHQAAAFTATPAPGYPDISIQWQAATADQPDEFFNLADGPLVIDGLDRGTIAGSDTNSLLITPNDLTPTLRLRAVVANTCGQSLSQPASLTPPPCPADFNNDGFTDFFDLQAFFDCFDADDCPPGRSADFNDDGFTDFFDLDAFLDAFDSGC